MTELDTPKKVLDNNEVVDLGALELGYLVRDAEAVTKIPGLPAYNIVLESPKAKNPLLPQIKDSLIVIPGKEKHKVLLFKNQSIERLPDKTSAELEDFVRFYNSRN